MRTFTIIFIFFLSTVSFSQWTQQTAPFSGPLREIFFINENTGWNVGDAHTIQRTSNGGALWTFIDINVSQYFTDVFFIDPNTGWVIASNIYKSTNSGLNWVDLGSLGGSFGSVYFINPLTGWAIGADNNGARILKTTNGGFNWSVKPCQTTNNLSKVCFPTNSTGYASGINGTVVKSTDAGETWFTLTTEITSHLSNLFFLNSETGWICCESGSFDSRLYRTTNGGQNWSIAWNFINGRMNTIHFDNINTGWAGGFGTNGKIFYTSNGGANWSQQLNYGGDGLYSIHMLNAFTGWAAGGSGRIYRTTNGGGAFTGFIPGHGEVPQKFIVYQNYPNPFNPTTVIEFDIPQKSFVSLSIYNSAGQVAEQVPGAELSAGSYSYKWDASGKPSGIYFYRITSGDFSGSGKMILLK